MKIAIISDVHNNTVNLQKILNYCKKNKIKTIVSCGDLAAEETLDFLCDNFSGEIFHTFGNMDEGQIGELDFSSGYKNAKIFRDFGEAQIAGRKVAFVHYPDVAKKLCETGKYKFVFYGHTHKPWEEIVGDCKMLNPGNVANEVYSPTFAIWNTKNDEFKLIRINELPQ
jgi:uncharacterized protein